MLKKIKLYSPAKINLFLKVIKKRKDGYHEIESVLQTISLCDVVILEEIKEGVEIVCDAAGVPRGKKNLIYKAVVSLFKHTGIKKGVRITIEKRIPVGGGLGGGSSNVASVLLGLNLLWQLKLNRKQLLLLAKEIGSDAPFFLYGGTAMVSGIGTNITPITPLPPVWFVIASSGLQISTSWVYKHLKTEWLNNGVGIEMMLTAIKRGDIKHISSCLYNTLEKVSIYYYPVIETLKYSLMDAGVMGALMSGSGSSVFGVVNDKDHAHLVYNRLKAKGIRVWIVKPRRSGVSVV